MSKTSKTAPLWVRATRSPELLEEWHDHRHGQCTLPPGPPTPADVVVHPASAGCGWVASRQFWFDGRNACACRICTDQAGRKRAARRSRHAGRRYVRDGWQREL